MISPQSPPTIELTDEQGSLRAAFVPTAGMICCSLRHRGEELLAQNAGLAAYAARGKTMGIPLLYPWANRLAGFDYVIAGRRVTVPHEDSLVQLDQNGLPIHGVIGGRMAWELPQPPEPGAGSLEARLAWTETAPERFAAFPFTHEVLYRASIAGDSLQIVITVHACGGDMVPVAFGFHPYLAPPGMTREEWGIELPPMRHLALDETGIPLGPEQTVPGRTFRLGQDAFDDGFEELASPSRFAVAAGGRRLTLEFLEGYPCAQVFSPPGGAFICFEPMTAQTNALRSGGGLRVLKPGERYRACFLLRVSDGAGAAEALGPAA